MDDVAGFFAFAGFGGEAVPTVVGFGGLQVVGSGELGKLEGDVLVLALDRAERGGVQVGEERSGGGEVAEVDVVGFVGFVDHEVDVGSHGGFLSGGFSERAGSTPALCLALYIWI